MNHPSRYPWVIVAPGLLNVLGSIGFARYGYPLILPTMKEDLGLTHTQMGLLGSGNFSGYLIASLVGGYLASKYGPRRVILLSFTLVATCMIVTGLSQGFLYALAATVASIGWLGCLLLRHRAPGQAADQPSSGTHGTL